MNIKISKLNQQFEGICHIDSKITFVKNSLPDEIIEIEKVTNHGKYNTATVKNIVRKNNKRIKSQCPYFNDCGGCMLCHLPYDETIKLKKESLLSLFKYNNIEFKKLNIINESNNKYYRNKISLKVINGKVGYFKNRSHDFLEIDECLIAKKSINKTIKNIQDIIKNGEIEIRCNYNDEILINIKTDEIINIDIPKIKNNIKLCGIILNDKTIYGDNFFYEIINNKIFKVSYNSFFQVNNNMNEKMQNIVLENIEPYDKVLDLYCGVGTFTIFSSLKSEYSYGVEISSSSINNALFNKKINNADNIEFFLGDTSKIINKINKSFSTIIIDPPRSGLNKKTRDFILNKKIKKVIYISCNPITFVRDLKELSSIYNLEKCYLLDSFSYTKHFECIALLYLKMI